MTLDHCETCNQMTNHNEEVCLKCTPTKPTDEIENEFRRQYDELGLRPKKVTMGNLEREIIIDFWRKALTQQKPAIEHCSEPQCPECDLVAYERGRKDEREATATLLTQRDEWWQEHEKDMYEEVEKSHRDEKEAMAEKVSKEIGKLRWKYGNNLDLDENTLIHKLESLDDVDNLFQALTEGE